MSDNKRAEDYLLKQIKQGSQQAWSQLVDRYQGRLLAFACSRVSPRADCEDVVQETFISFANSLNNFRGDCSLETYLFLLLRRKIIDNYRKGSKNICLIQDSFPIENDSGISDAFEIIPGAAETPSFYARNDESHDQQHKILTEALSTVINRFKKSLNFTALQVIELLFYSQLSNAETAKALQLTPSRVGVIKHRCIDEINREIQKLNVSGPETSMHFESLMTEVWQSQRLSCPKRSTVGAYLLETLDPNWYDYVDFHLNKLGCQYCLANLEDLKQQDDQKTPHALYARIMESTVGFFHKPS